MKKKYMYLSDFTIKRINNYNLKIYKKNFIEINESSKKIIDINLTEEIKKLPNFDDENQSIINKLSPIETEEMITTFTEKILKRKFSEFLKKPTNAKELMIFSVSVLFKEIYEENHKDLIFDDISGFNPIYHKKKCDLIIIKKFLEKYKIILKRFILYEEVTFVNEIETKNKSISKADLKNIIKNYNSMLKLCENYIYELKNIILSIPDFKRDLIRRHGTTEKTKPLRNSANELEDKINQIILEFETISINIRKRKDYIISELDKNHINWSIFLKKKIIERIFMIK